MASPLAAACLLTVLGLAAGAQDSPASRPFTEGEVIVKFASGSRVAAEIELAASRGAEPTAEIRTAVRDLSKELGVVLDPIRLGSGGTLLLSVRKADLSQTIARRLREEASVKDASVVPKAAGMVLVQFEAGTMEASALSLTDATERTAAARTITIRFEERIGLPLRSHLDGPGQLMVGPALPKWTLQLVDRLNKRADVEYAQPNYTHRLRGGFGR